MVAGRCNTPLISVITPTFNAADVLAGTLASVRSQRYPRVEHIVIDGASSDDTSDLLGRQCWGSLRYVSEPDGGIYHAMNKGLAMATGDVIGFLGAGDHYFGPNSLELVAEEFRSAGVDSVIGDLVYFDSSAPQRVIRTYTTPRFRPKQLTRGIMPPHMATFINRRLLLTVGGFDESFRIAGDFDRMIKLFSLREASYSYLPEVLVRMRRGGVSNGSVRSRLLINREMRNSCRLHGVKTSWVRLLSRYPGKVWQSLKHGPHAGI